MTSNVTVSPDASAESNSISRIFGVLFSPKETFDSIAARPTWIAPVILLCAIGVAVTFFFGQRVGWRSFMEKQNASNSRVQSQMEQMTPDQKEQMLETQTKWASAISYAFVTVGAVIVFVIIAAVYLGTVNLIGGTRIGFKTSLAIVAYAWVPFAIHGLLGLLIIFLKDPATVDIQNLVASNPGAFLSDDSPKWLSGLLTSFDLFTFWVMALLAFGYSAANPKKFTFGKAFGFVFAVWFIYVLIVKVGIAAAFS